MYRLFFSSRAQRAFHDLSPEEARRTKTALDRLQENPRVRGVVALQDLRFARYRYRVGNRRILFDINDSEQAISILDIRRRDEKTYR